MRNNYERPEAQIVDFAAMEQLALLQPRVGGETDLGGGNGGMTGSVGGRGDDY